MLSHIPAKGLLFTNLRGYFYRRLVPGLNDHDCSPNSLLVEVLTPESASSGVVMGLATARRRLVIGLQHCPSPPKCGAEGRLTVCARGHHMFLAAA